MKLRIDYPRIRGSVDFACPLQSITLSTSIHLITAQNIDFASSHHRMLTYGMDRLIVDSHIMYVDTRRQYNIVDGHDGHCSSDVV